MGSATYINGRTLNFRPITRSAEIPLISTYQRSPAPGHSLDIQALVALSGSDSRIELQQEGQMSDRVKKQPAIVTVTSVQPVVVPFYVRNNDLNLKEFEIY